MTVTEQHKQLVDAIYSANTVQEARNASAALDGFLKGLEACGMKHYTCTCGEPHIQTPSHRIVHRYDGNPCYIADIP